MLIFLRLQIRGAGQKESKITFRDFEEKFMLAQFLKREREREREREFYGFLPERRGLDRGPIPGKRPPAIIV